MSQTPRWYRKKILEDKLSNVIRNPYSDVTTVQAAKKAIEKKLDQQDRDYHYSQVEQTNKFLELL